MSCNCKKKKIVQQEQSVKVKTSEKTENNKNVEKIVEKLNKIINPQK